MNTLSLSAQVSSQKGWFTADFNAGCAPFNITITHTGVRSGSLFIDFMGDAADPFSGTGFSDTFITGETRTNATVYSTAGTFIIRVVDQSGSGNNQDRFDFLEITVTEPITPTFTVGICNNTQVLLQFDFTQDTYDFYEVDFGDGQPIVTLDKTGANQLNYAYGNESNYTINVSGRLNNGANAGCGAATPVTITTLQNIPDPEINSMTVIDPTTVDLTYAPLLPNVSYGLYLSSNGGGFSEVATLDPATNGQAFQYISTDPNVDFNFGQYAFQVVAQEICTATTIESNTIQNVRAGFMASYSGSTLALDRMWNSQDPNGILNQVSLTYNGANEVVNTAVSGMSSLNLSGCTDVSSFFFEATFGTAISRSITITPDLSVITLTPAAPLGLAGQVGGGALQLSYDAAPFNVSEYRIYQVTATGNQLEQSTTALNVTVSNFTLSESEVCYVLTYVDECGNESEISEPICFQFSPNITVPTAFSPNGDGENDQFNIPNGIFLNFNMEIYNRWGSLIFVTNDAAAGWDGNMNGRPAPMGGYVYKINYNSGQDRPVSLTGSFTLIR